jgi:hypothetical protein
VKVWTNAELCQLGVEAGLTPDEISNQGIKGKYLPESVTLIRELALYPRDMRVRMIKRAWELALAEGKEKPETQHIREAAAEMSDKGKKRLIKALINKLRGIKKPLPDAINWEELGQLQRLEVMTLLAGIERHCSMLLLSAQQPQTVDLEAEVKPSSRPASIREIPPPEKK